ncbi:hypothetical protein FRC12_024878 [Ceratobasidium sp. 428]|nr:hypothetical protein FRC12_024878 [Ceratobasidium sp. 428]
MFDFSDKISSVIQNPLSLFNNPPPSPDAYGIGPNFDWSVARSPPAGSSQPVPTSAGLPFGRPDNTPRLPTVPPAYTSPYPPPATPSLRPHRFSSSGQNRLHPYRRPEADARQPPRTVLDPLYDWSRHGSPIAFSNARTATPTASTRYQTPVSQSQSRFATPRPPSTPANATPFFSPAVEGLTLSGSTFAHNPSPQIYPPPPRSAFDSISQALSASMVAAPIQTPPSHNSGIFGHSNGILPAAYDTSNFEEDTPGTQAPAAPLIAPQPSTAGQSTLAWMAQSQDRARRPLFLLESSPQTEAYYTPSPAPTPSPASRAPPTTISVVSSPVTQAVPTAPVVSAAHAIPVAPVVPRAAPAVPRAAPVAPRTAPVAPTLPVAPVAPATPVTSANPVAHTFPSSLAGATEPQIARTPPGAPVTNATFVDPHSHSAYLTAVSYKDPVISIQSGSETSDDIDEELAEAWGMSLQDTGFQSSNARFQSSDSWIDELADELSPSSSGQVQEVQSGSSKVKAAKSPRSQRRQQKKPMGDKWLGGPGGGFKFNSKPAGVDESMLRKTRWSYSEDGPASQNPNERLEGDVHFSPATEPGDKSFICWVCTLSSVGLMQWVCFRAGQPHPQYAGFVFKPPQLPQTPPRWIKESSYKSTQL